MELSVDTRTKWLKRAAIGVPLALMAAWLADGYLWDRRPAATPEVTPLAAPAPAVAPLVATPSDSAVIDLAEPAVPPKAARRHAKRRTSTVAVAADQAAGVQVGEAVAPMPETVAVAPAEAGQIVAETPPSAVMPPAKAEHAAAPFPFSMLAAACALPGELGKSLNRAR